MAVKTVGSALSGRARSEPDEIAIFCPDAGSMTIAQLADEASRIYALLRRSGVSRTDRVAMLMPAWGPHTAVAGLSIETAASLVMLNPDSSENEARSLLTRLWCRAFVTVRDWHTAARTAADKLGTIVIELDPELGTAGHFVGDSSRGDLDGSDSPRPQDEIYVTTTTGTTAEPKLVSRTQGDYLDELLKWATVGKRRTLGLMPLQSVIGLFALTSSVAGGGGACVLPTRFDADRIVEWLAEYGIATYAGTAAVHAAVLEDAHRHPEFVARTRLETIVHHGTPLPPAMSSELERTFRCNVMVTYGMVETGMIAAMPPGMGGLKPGSVGVPTIDLRIVNEHGLPVTLGEQGEIQVRGPLVISKYLDDAKATAEAFADGWFLTGDLGFQDKDGYLTITGRSKEQIQRAGLKVSPFEVEAAVRSHAGVDEVVVFPVPHLRMGEKVAMAVVRTDENVTAEALRDHALQRLAPHKVPRVVRFVESIPTHGGKVARLRLAEQLGVGIEGFKTRSQSAELTQTQARLARIWRQILELPANPGPNDDFFELGGDSLLATQMYLDAEAEFSVALPPSALIVDSTLAAVASAIDDVATTASQPCLVPVQKGSSGAAPLLWVHDFSGTIFVASRLAFQLGSHQPVMALQPARDRRAEPATSNMQATVERYVAEVTAAYPEGPYILGGHSLGGGIAFEMARVLRRSGYGDCLVLMVDTLSFRSESAWARRINNFRHQSQSARKTAVREYMRHRVGSMPPRPLDRSMTLIAATNRPTKIDASVVFFRARDSVQPSAAEFWQSLVNGPFEVVDVEGTHGDCAAPPHVDGLITEMGRAISRWTEGRFVS